MKASETIKYYSQDGFRKFMLGFSKNREVVPRFGDFLGSRPQSFFFDSDIINTIRQGASSFHVSIERWSNPMALSTDLDKGGLDDLRSGWDLIFDVDTKCLDYAKVCAKLVIDALDFNDVKNVSVKFSGGNGFHIGVSFGSPEIIKGVPVKNFFPDAPRIIGLYIQEMIKDLLRENLLSIDSPERISERAGITVDEFNADVFKVVNIDPIAISPRHLIRAPYSLNEKKWLVSIPIDPHHVSSFSADEALPDRVTFDRGFLDKPCDLSNLFRQAFDWFDREESKKIKAVRTVHEVPKNAVPKNCFPPCVNYVLAGIPDGRKRSLFMLINFLTKCGYSWDAVSDFVSEWNSRNKPPLKEGYVRSQIDWASKTGSLMPPNCSSPNYKDISACHPDDLCLKIKNPVTYALHKNKALTKPIRNGKFAVIPKPATLENKDKPVIRGEDPEIKINPDNIIIKKTKRLIQKNKDAPIIKNY